MTAARNGVTLAGASPAVTSLLTSLRDIAAPREIDRLWLFAPRILAGRECGLLVLSLEAGADAPEYRRLVTVAYEARPGSGLSPLSREVVQQGRVPVDRVPRLMAGVLARLRDEPGEPVEERVGFDPALWAALVQRLGGPAA